MPTGTVVFSSLKVITLLLALAAVAAPIGGSNLRKLDESSASGPPADGEVKCGGCSSCQNPCYQSPPPPSPPPPHKKPPTPYCPPPPAPPSSLLYITGPPGELYPVDNYYASAGRSLMVGLPILVVCGLLNLLFMW